MLILKGFDAWEPLKFCFVEYSFSLINSARECISSQRSLVNDGRATHIDHVVDGERIHRQGSSKRTAF
jgi:hypothetical protein